MRRQLEDGDIALEDATSRNRIGRCTAARTLAVVLMAALLLAAGCGTGSEATSQLASTGEANPGGGADVAPADDVADEPVAEDPTDGDSSYGDPDGEDTADGYSSDGYSTDGEPVVTSGIDVDPAWVPLLEPRFVSQAPLGSIVTLYGSPDVDSDVVGSVKAGEVGLILYDLVEEIDGKSWSPVQTRDGVVGWIKTGLLRPEPSVTPPERIGDSALRGSDALRLAIAGLSAPEILADQIDERGLTMSSSAFIDDDAVVLTAEQLQRPAADDTEVVTWGVEAGVGDPITATMTQRFADLAGSTAITSTEATGFNVQVGVGNIPSNVAEVFPGAEWVELHFSGTEAFGGLDWESITFVFDTSGEVPVLLAITMAAWTP